MILDLFSAFEPKTYIMSLNLSLNWLSSLLTLLFIPCLFWVSINRISSIFEMVLSFLLKEFKIIVKNKQYSGILLFISLLCFILLNNFLGMFPYIFTSSSHLSFSLVFSLSLWMSFMIFGWVNFTKFMFAHLVPSGTPAVLMPFMVCIESISNFIRSGTLAVRLSANMISGHLLLSLLGNQGSSLSIILCLILIILQLALLSLEFSVCFIQSYVFTVLSALYSSESVGH
uniref:ATP synthase subunit a n=1 Tax=Franklinothrips vespiformis TaxID=297892 RepID=A0A8A5L5F8_FRAVS|nr:ATP synthase F0 subunit 6 [Franklinothrips vespiformis]